MNNFVCCAMAGVFNTAEDIGSPVVSPGRSLTPKVPAEFVPCRCLLVGGGRPFRTFGKVSD